MTIERDIPLLESLLQKWQSVIGTDYDGYKNHVYRMLNFCFYLHPPTAEEREKLIIAAAFHDLGIWTDHTIDYLPPSINLAKTYLSETGQTQWSEEIGLIIDEHHKLTKYRNRDYPLVEIFRRGDLVDFSLGAIKFGVPKAYITTVKASFPNAGFHKRLVQLSMAQLKKNPLNPAPMMKW